MSGGDGLILAKWSDQNTGLNNLTQTAGTSARAFAWVGAPGEAVIFTGRARSGTGAVTVTQINENGSQRVHVFTLGGWANTNFSAGFQFLMWGAFDVQVTADAGADFASDLAISPPERVERVAPMSVGLTRSKSAGGVADWRDVGDQTQTGPISPDGLGAYPPGERSDATIIQSSAATAQLEYRLVDHAVATVFAQWTPGAGPSVFVHPPNQRLQARAAAGVLNATSGFGSITWRRV